MRVYKDDVIDALNSEPLTFGTFISYSKCSSCAVGSILSSLHCKPTEEDVMNLQRRCETAVIVTESIFFEGSFMKPTNWFEVLSIFWEELGHNDVPIEEARTIMMDYVEEVFPNYLGKL